MNLDEILDEYGYIGAHFYNQFHLKLTNFKTKPENFILNIIENYSKNIQRNDAKGFENAKTFIEIISSKIFIFKNLIESRMIFKKEIILFKILFDILIHFSIIIDKFNFITSINEILLCNHLFFSSINNDDFKYIYESINKMKNLKEVLTNNLKGVFVLSKKKSKYLKI